MKQTALDLVIEQLKEQIRKSTNNKLGTNRTGDYRIGLIKAIGLCKKAKEMEKEKIKNAYQQGYNNAYFNNPISKDQYYNETFEKKQDETSV